jgi:CRISPR type I-E-associated protein CasB/Cse2
MTATRAEEHPEAALSPRQRFYRSVQRLASALDESTEGSLAKGEKAALRRDDGALSPTFYKLAASLLEAELDRYTYEPVRLEAERRWARVAHGIAKLGGQHLAGARSFGAALAVADLAESRFLRLLRAHGDALESALRAAIAPLDQKAVALDVVDLAALVLSAPHATQRFHFEEGEAVRRRLARDYYRAQRQDNEGPSS